MMRCFIATAVLFWAPLALASDAPASTRTQSCHFPSSAVGGRDDPKVLRPLFDQAMAHTGDCCREPVSEPLRALCLLSEDSAKRRTLPTARMTRKDIEWIWHRDSVVQKTGGRGDM